MDDFDEGPDQTLRRGGIYRVGDWQTGYHRGPAEALGSLLQTLVEALQRIPARAGWVGDPEDLAHNKMADWLEKSPPAPLGWPPRAPFASYVGRIAWRILTDEFRRRGHPLETGETPEAAFVDPAALEMLRVAEIRVDLESLQTRLPQPWKQILGWLTAGETKRQIAKRLHDWGGIGPDWSGWLVQETRAIVEESLHGKGDRLRDLLAREGKRKKSRWRTTPPP